MLAKSGRELNISAIQNNKRMNEEQIKNISMAVGGATCGVTSSAITAPTTPAPTPPGQPSPTVNPMLSRSN